MSHIVPLYRDLWAQILGALDPGTDLHAAVLAIAPVSWDADLTDDQPATSRTSRGSPGTSPAGTCDGRPPRTARDRGGGPATATP